MADPGHKDKRIFEIMSIILALGMTTLFYKMGQQRMVTLNLFFLPVILNAYYLGRTSAGVMALFCALAVTIVSTLNPTGFAALDFPIMVGLALTVWAAVLGMTALLTGTLCDERAKTVDELHKAYVGVVDVLSKYLQSANPDAEARSIRVAELSQEVAQEMNLSRKEIDDIRVAALLHDLGSVEVTTQIINKAVNTLDANSSEGRKYTFLGTDLVHSLGSVLDGALPLLASQDDGVQDCLSTQAEFHQDGVPLGAKIISAVRGYDALARQDPDKSSATARHALKALRKERPADYDEILNAIERVTLKSTGATVLEPAYD